MTAETGNALRPQFLDRVVRKECQHTTTTGQRLFGGFFPGTSNPDVMETPIKALDPRFRGDDDLIGVS